MNTANSMSNISNNKLNQIAESIADSANQIFDTFHTSSVWFSGAGLQNQSNFKDEHFDIVIKNIIKIKKNLQDAKSYISLTQLDYKDVEIFIVWTQNTIDSIEQLMIDDLYFKNTFEFAMREIVQLVWEVRNEIVFEE